MGLNGRPTDKHWTKLEESCCGEGRGIKEALRELGWGWGLSESETTEKKMPQKLLTWFMRTDRV